MAGLQDRREPRWPAELALVVAVALYVVLPDRLIIGPRWLVPVLEGLLAVPVGVRHRLGRPPIEPLWRTLAVGVILLITLANIGSVALLVHALLDGTKATGTQLLYAAVNAWVTNVMAFGLWFWELDRGGPTARGAGTGRPDFYFPQMQSPDLAPPGWYPKFWDYLYVAYTNATAFSPTDAMPLSMAAKALMSLESTVSLVAVTVIAARAINILA